MNHRLYSDVGGCTNHAGGKAAGKQLTVHQLKESREVGAPQSIIRCCTPPNLVFLFLSRVRVRVSTEARLEDPMQARSRWDRKVGERAFESLSHHLLKTAGHLEQSILTLWMELAQRHHVSIQSLYITSCLAGHALSDALFLHAKEGEQMDYIMVSILHNRHSGIQRLSAPPIIRPVHQSLLWR